MFKYKNKTYTKEKEYITQYITRSNFKNITLHNLKKNKVLSTLK